MKKLLCIFVVLVILTSCSGQNIDCAEITEQAKEASLSGDHPKAIELLSVLIEECGPLPEDVKYFIHLIRASSYYRTGEYEKAAEDLEIIIQAPKNEYDSIIHYSLVCLTFISHELNDLEKALYYAKLSAENKPESSTYSGVGYYAILTGNYDEAMYYLNKAVDYDEVYLTAYSNMALLYLKLNDLDKARECINKAILIDKTNPYIYKHSALIYIELGDFENACIELDKAKELNYENYSSRIESGEVNELIRLYCK